MELPIMIGIFVLLTHLVLVAERKVKNATSLENNINKLIAQLEKAEREAAFWHKKWKEQQGESTSGQS